MRFARIATIIDQLRKLTALRMHQFPWLIFCESRFLGSSIQWDLNSCACLLCENLVNGFIRTENRQQEKEEEVVETVEKSQLDYKLLSTWCLYLLPNFSIHRPILMHGIRVGGLGLLKFNRLIFKLNGGKCKLTF